MKVKKQQEQTIKQQLLIIHISTYIYIYQYLYIHITQPINTYKHIKNKLESQ